MLTQLLFATLASALLIASPADAHVSLANPAPRGGNTDANNAPYNSQGTMWPSFPCQGKPAGGTTATLQAGGSFRVDMVRHVAVHRGGHCQWAISYDNGKNFAIIQTNYNNCPGLNKYVNGKEQNEQFDGTSSWDIKVPADLPAADRAVFAWTWVPTVSGPAEYYMNCVDVKINSNAKGGYTGKKLVVVNTPGTPLIQNDLNRLKSMIESSPSITVGGNGQSSGGGSSPPPQQSGGGGGNTGAAVGCPEGLCKSKWGYCGTGGEYCNSASAALDGAESGDAEGEESEEVEGFANESVPSFSMDGTNATVPLRGLSANIPDEHLYSRGEELVAQLEELRKVQAEIQSELSQLDTELQIRNEYDSWAYQQAPQQQEEEEEEEEQPRRSLFKRHHKVAHLDEADAGKDSKAGKAGKAHKKHHKKHGKKAPKKAHVDSAEEDDESDSFFNTYGGGAKYNYRTHKWQ